jgi:hypothetical protein
LSRCFITAPGVDEIDLIREDVADIFNFPHTQKIDPKDIIEPCQILFVRAKLLKNDAKWQQARILLFEILNRILALVDNKQISRPFRESFIAELADDYEEMALGDPEFDDHKSILIKEAGELLDHDSAEGEGVYLEQLSERLELDESP